MKREEKRQRTGQFSGIGMLPQKCILLRGRGWIYLFLRHTMIKLLLKRWREKGDREGQGREVLRKYLRLRSSSFVGHVHIV